MCTSMYPVRAPIRFKMLVVGGDPILPGVVQYLRLLISSVTIGEVSSGSDVPGVARNSAWDLIVLDLQGADDLAILGKLKQAQPDIPVLVLNLDPSPIGVRDAMAAGASGFLDKSRAAREWRLAVETVVAGGSYPSTDLTQNASNQL